MVFSAAAREAPTREPTLCQPNSPNQLFDSKVSPSINNETAIPASPARLARAASGANLPSRRQKPLGGPLQGQPRKEASPSGLGIGPMRDQVRFVPFCRGGWTGQSTGLAARKRLSLSAAAVGVLARVLSGVVWARWDGIRIGVVPPGLLPGGSE